MEKNTKEKITIKNAKEEEKLAILTEADKIKGEQLVIDVEGLKTESEIEKFKLNAIDDPERKYELYYMGINRLLLKFLPKGLKYERARHYIYEEKNTFLTRGKRINKKGIRGGDSRMGYIDDIQELFDIILNWVASNGTMAELFNQIRELNISRGYGSSNN